MPYPFITLLYFHCPKIFPTSRDAAPQGESCIDPWLQLAEMQLRNETSAFVYIWFITSLTINTFHVITKTDLRLSKYYYLLPNIIIIRDMTQPEKQSQ